MPDPSPRSIRRRLVAVVVLATVPALLLGLQRVRERQAAVEALGQDAARVYLQAVRTRVLQLESGTRQLLLGLAQMPAFQAADPATCGQLLSALQPAFSEYGNIGLGEPDGTLVCNVRRPDTTVRLTDPSIARVVTTGRPAMSGLSYGPIAREYVVLHLAPVTDARGRVVRIIGASINMRWLSQQFAALGLPPGSSVALEDDQGRYLTRWPDYDQWVNRVYPRSDSLAAAFFAGRAGDEAFFRTNGPDHVNRLYAIARLPDPDGGPTLRYLWVGVPAAPLLAEALRTEFLHLAVLFLLVVLGGLIAWLLADRLVVRPAAALAATATRLAAGDFSARSGLAHGEDEMGRLGRTLDGLAAALAERDARLEQGRRQLEATADALRASEQRFARALEAADEGLWEYDHLRDMVTPSPRFAAMLGVTVAEVTGSFAGLMARIHPEDRAAFQRAIELHESRQAPRVQAEYRMRHADGTWRWIASHGRVVEWGDDGRPRLAVGTQVDVTERRQLADQLQHAQRLEAVGQMTGAVAHDFNNLLQVFWATLEELRLDHPEVAREEAYGQLRQHLERARQMTAHLLQFSRREPVPVTAIDLNATISGCLPMLRRAVGPEVVVDADLAPGAYLVRGDAVRCEQVLLNLAINARDAMPQGGALTVTTRPAELGVEAAARVPGLQPGPFVELTVADTGTGMAPEVAARIFDPFFTTKGPEKGTGLGLSTVYGIITQCGGHIRVASTPGRGTCFTLLWPLVADPALAGR